MKLKKDKSKAQANLQLHGGREKNAKQLVKWARQYIQLGWKVFLTPPGSKKPFAGSHGSHDATGDIEVIRKMAKEYPDANLAIAMGQVSGLFALDTDLYRDGASVIFAELETKYGKLPETLTALTARGGEHLIFACDCKTPNWQAKFGPGFDVRGDGGYVMAEPSMFEGKKYRWKTKSTKRSKIPPVWFDAMCKASSYPTTSEVKSGVTIPEGARNGMLVARAFDMKRLGKTQDEVLTHLHEWNQTRCAVPLPDRDIVGIAQRVFKHANSTSTISSSVALTSRPVRKTTTLAEIEELNIKPLVWALRKLLPVGVTLFAGTPKIGKSFMGVQMGLTVATGKRLWAGRKPEERGEVLYLAYEDNNRRMKSRAHKLMDGKPLPKRFHVDYNWPRMDQGGIEDLENWLAAHPKARLVIIDTLAKFRSTTFSSRTAYDFDYEVGSKLIPVAERHHVAIVLIHHTAKGARADELESINSTNGLSGGVDSVMILSRTRNTKDGALFISGRDVEERKLAMERLPNQRWISLGNLDEVMTSAERKRILTDLTKHGPSKPKDIAKRTEQKGEAIRQLLAKMIADGQVSVNDNLYAVKGSKK